MQLMNLVYLNILIVCTVIGLIVSVSLGREFKKILLRNQIDKKS